MQIIGNHRSAGSMRHIFVAIGAGGETEGYLREVGAEVLCLNKPVEIPSMGAIVGLLRCFRNCRPVAVHTHGCEANFHGLFAARLAGVPVRIGEEIGIPSHSWKARQLFRIAFSNAQQVIGMSKVVADWLVSNGEVPRSKALVVHNPVRLPRSRETLQIDGRRFRICFVGRLEKVKNPVVLIGMMKRLKESNREAELWIIGDGSQRRMLEMKALSDGVEDRVVFHGYQKDPANFLRQSDLCVQPSLSEGFSQSLIEAMGCGVPVVVTPTGGAREVVEEGRTGWVVPSADEESITDAVRKAYDLGPQKLFSMGQLARSSVENKFDPDRYILELENLYCRPYPK